MMPIATAEQIAELNAHLAQQKKWDHENMPDLETALMVFAKAYRRLKDFGFQDIIYHPKDGGTFEVIEPGSTGIFPCQYWETPTRGSFWIMQDGGCPSHPCLWRPAPETNT